MDGKPIRRVLEWLLNRDLTDADMAAALEYTPVTTAATRTMTATPPLRSWPPLVSTSTSAPGCCR